MLRLVPLLAMAGLLLSNGALAQATSGQVNPCSGKRGEETRTLFDYRNRIDLALYNTVPGRYTTSQLRGPRGAELQQKAREGAYTSAFSTINQLGLSYDRAQPFYLDGYRRLRSINDQSILGQDIKIYREWETRNWDDCIYTYAVELAVPKFPSLGEELDQALKTLVARELRNKPTGRTGELEISIVRMLELLLSDPGFKAKLQRALTNDAFKDNLRFKDDDTQLLIESASGKVIQIAGYPKGQYRVNAVVASIIRQSVMPVVRFYLENYGDVVVDCEGYADRLKVTGAISYVGDADFNALGAPVTYSPAPRSQGQAKERGIRNNDHLSAARAYEGIAALSSALGRWNQNSALTLRYSGQGETGTSKSDHPASRKIIFRITYNRPRG